MMVYYLEPGDRVIANSTLPNQPDIVGILRYIGPTSYKEGTWAGIELDEYSLDGKLQYGKNDGSINGIRYFTCQPGKGIFVNANRVQRCYREPFLSKIPPSQHISNEESKSLDIKSVSLTVKKPYSETFDHSFQQKNKMEENPFLINSKKWEGTKNELLETITSFPEKIDSFDLKSKELMALISSTGPEWRNKIDGMEKTFSNSDAKRFSQNSTRKLEIVQTQAENDNYQEIIKRYRDEVDRLYIGMDDKKQEIENLSRNYAKVLAQLNDIKLRYGNAELESTQRINILEDELQRLTSQNVSNTGNTELIRSQLLKRIDETKSLNIQIDEARIQLFNEKKNYEMELALLKSENASLKREITNLKTTEKTGDQMDVKKQHFDALYSDFIELQNAYRELENSKILDITALNRKLAESEKQRQLILDQSTDLLSREEQLLKRENELFEEEERIMKLRAQELEGRIRGKFLASKAENVVDGTSMEMTRIDKSLSLAQISNLENRLADKENELRIAQSQFEESVDQVARLKKLLERQQDEISRLKLQKDVTRTDTRMKMEDITQTRTSNEIELEKNNLRKEVVRLKNLIATAEETILPLVNNEKIQTNVGLLKKAKLTEARLIDIKSKLGNLHFSQMVEQCAKMVRNKFSMVKV